MMKSRRGCNPAWLQSSGPGGFTSWGSCRERTNVQLSNWWFGKCCYMRWHHDILWFSERILGLKKYLVTSGNEVNPAWKNSFWLDIYIYCLQGNRLGSIIFNMFVAGPGVDRIDCICWIVFNIWKAHTHRSSPTRRLPWIHLWPLNEDLGQMACWYIP